MGMQSELTRPAVMETEVISLQCKNLRSIGIRTFEKWVCPSLAYGGADSKLLRQFGCMIGLLPHGECNISWHWKASATFCTRLAKGLVMTKHWPPIFTM
jgi:hypothetical protein